MVESSKILTVSYGTFSCTLEGFEDSFGTMKAIAEYFRDLAAEDRYFGAEPPTPDPEMLSRIAEREIARRVEAHQDDTGIRLRATALPGAIAAAEAVSEPVPAEHVEPAAVAEEAVAEAPIEPETTATAEQEAPEVVAEEEPVAEAAPEVPQAEETPAMPPMMERPFDAPDLSALSPADPYAPVAGALLAEPAPYAAAAPEVAAPTYQEPLIEEAAPAPLAAEETAEYEDDAVEASEIDETPETFATFEDMQAAEQMYTPAPPAAHPDSESVAAKLQRIRAVVGSGVVGNDLDAEDESEDAQGFADQFEDDMPQDVEDEENAADQEAAAEIDANARARAVEIDALNAAEEESEDEDDALLAFADETADEDYAEDLEFHDPEPATSDVIAKDEDADEDVSDPGDEEEAFAPADDAEAAEANEEHVEEQAQAEDEDGLADVETAQSLEEEDDGRTASLAADDSDEAADEVRAQRPTIRARILKLARPLRAGAKEDDTAEEDDAEETSAEEAPLVLDTPAQEPLVASDVEEPIGEHDADDLPEEDAVADHQDVASHDDLDTAEISEDNLAASAADEDADQAVDLGALDGVEDFGAVEAADETPLDPEDEAELQEELADVAREADEIRAQRSGRDILPDTDDTVGQIMDRADEQLSEPEGNRRRNAIAQLKAAVAATEAARQLGEPKESESKSEEAFRKDFSEVVKPRRATSLPRTEVRTERPRPAPLKLVASQRIDAPEGDVEQVQPRRISHGSEEVIGDVDSFAQFAEEMGAHELPDLLEAAAAYTSYVEGIEDFSRPQIMKKVQASTDLAFSREDGLRSFGTLLRQGRINKVHNGRFQVSDQTRFKPEQRAG